jgi:hypothetical protein
MVSFEDMMHDDTNNMDALVSSIAKLASTPGRATTSGPTFDIPSATTPLAVFEQQERRLGFRLPLLLRRLYTEVGNGGFGPGHGLLSILALSPVDRDIPTYYSSLRESCARRQSEWPAGVVPFNDWGDLIVSCVDLSDETSTDPPVLRFEPNMSPTATVAFLHGLPFRGAGVIPESDKLSTWFQDWVADREMFNRPYSSRALDNR